MSHDPVTWNAISHHQNEKMVLPGKQRSEIKGVEHEKKIGWNDHMNFQKKATSMESRLLTKTKINLNMK